MPLIRSPTAALQPSCGFRQFPGLPRTYAPPDAAIAVRGLRYLIQFRWHDAKKGSGPVSNHLVHLICGSTGAGKTTYARRLADEIGAVVFSIDEWMAALFWMDAP